MSDIFREVDEDLRRDRMQDWVKRYGGIVLALALLIVGGTAGYTAWRGWQQSQQEKATADLSSAIDRAAQGPEQAAQALAAFVQGGAPADLATLARMSEAALLVRAGKPAEAVKIYDAIAADSGVEPVYRDLASLMAVLHQLDTGDAAQMQARLQPLTADTSPWRFTARELSGLLAARSGDRAKARTLFQQLANDSQAPAGIRARAADLAAFYGKS